MKTKARDFPRFGYALMCLSAISLYIGMLVQDSALQAIIIAKAVALLGVSLSVLSARHQIAAPATARRKR